MNLIGWFGHVTFIVVLESADFRITMSNQIEAKQWKSKWGVVIG